VSLASSRDSDIRPGLLPGDDTENTFVFTVPPREVPDLQQSDDNIDSPIRNDGENNDFGELNVTAAEDTEEVWNPVHEDVDLSIMESTLQDTEAAMTNTRKVARKKRIKISKHGIQYPSLPAGVIKKLATTYARTSGNSKAKISKDTLDAIMQATDWFFEQVSDDLGAYAEHAGRKTIEESDVITLMGRYVSPTHKAAYLIVHVYRQRQTNTTATPFSLAQRFLPRELLQELRMVPPSKIKRGRQLEQVEEVDEDMD
jgi:histone H3/H4